MESLRHGASGTNRGEAVGEGSASSSATFADLLWAVENLRVEIRSFTDYMTTAIDERRFPPPAGAGPGPERAEAPVSRPLAGNVGSGPSARVGPAPEPVQAELTRVRAERDALKADLDAVRKELALLSFRPDDPDRLTLVMRELISVVCTTEEATNTILDMTETILRHNDSLREQTDDTAVLTTLDTVQGLMIRVLEACNFQDLTGQRINKVLSVLQFIDSRVRSMVAVVGAPDEDTDAAAASPPFVPPVEEPGAEPDSESHLLNGPQDKDRSITQAEIDALFR